MFYKKLISLFKRKEIEKLEEEIAPVNKWRKFEIFIGKYFKDSGDFDLMKKPHEYVEGLKAEEDDLPDFKFRDKRSGKVFWVECKWRPKWNIEKTFFNKDKIKFYQHFQKKDGHKIFIALGIGKEIETEDKLKPKELYFFPVNMLSDYVFLRKSYLIKGDRQHNFKYKKPKFFQAYHDLK